MSSPNVIGLDDQVGMVDVDTHSQPLRHVGRVRAILPEKVIVVDRFGESHLIPWHLARRARTQEKAHGLLPIWEDR
jgi:hypothetical protein